MALRVTCLERIKIRNHHAGLTEPSGVALTADGQALWTVSDDTRRIFRLSLSGKLDEKGSFRVKKKSLEGITAHPDGDTLFAAREKRNELIKLSAADRAVAARRRLADMAGYAPIARFFDDDKNHNKGLEGVAWNTRTGTLFCLKEGEPGLLIEVEPDLSAVRGHVELHAANGFVDPRGKRKIDFSDLCHDPVRNGFWIVSDQARRVYFYDGDENQVRDSAALSYEKDGARRTVKKAEGVAIDPATNRLYVVSDSEARLYIFAVET